MGGMKTDSKPNARRVLALLGIMSGIGCLGTEPNPFAMQMYTIECSIIDYRGWSGRFPDSLDELTQSTTLKSIRLEKKDLTDPWGEPIGYAQGGDRFAVWSTGRDKIMGTRDDYIEGHHSLYVECWRALQVESGMDAEAANEAEPESIARLPKPAPPLSPEEQARLEEEARKESEQAGEEYRRTRQVFLRKFWTGAIIRILGIVLVLGIAAAAVWSRARKKSGRK